MTYELLCMRHDGSSDLCYRQTNELFRLQRDVNCGQVEGLGCCLGSYLQVRTLTPEFISHHCFQRLSIHNSVPNNEMNSVE